MLQKMAKIEGNVMLQKMAKMEGNESR